MNTHLPQFNAATPSSDVRSRAVFDGVICFGGEDWWYHNRGHYDMQMMRQLETELPVVYVNSLGMRVPAPTEGRMFLTRVRRKLASIRRGHVRVGERFGVVSPPALPGALGLRVTRPLIARAIRAAARRHGIRRPLAWIACPTALPVARSIGPVASVYQRTDRYECFGGVDPEHIRRCDRDLKAYSDLTVFCSSALFDEEAAACRRAIYADHGVDAARFADAADRRTSNVVARRYRVGFIGGIDAHTFDPALFLAVAAALPDIEFVLIGACSLPSGWCTRPNVTMAGQQPYESIPKLAAACDVLIMPWNRSRWIEACHPVKLKEYLASGRPIVSTPFAELARYEGLVSVARDPVDFAAGVRAAIADPGDVAARRHRVSGESWERKAKMIVNELEAAGIVSASRAVARSSVPVRPRRAPTGTSPIARIQPVTPNRAPTACIVLAGGLRPSPVVVATGRCVLDLCLTPGRSVGAFWIERIEEIENATGATIRTRIVHPLAGPVPWPIPGEPNRAIIEQEPQPFRGAAGVLRDLCGDVAPDDNVLVIEAAQYATVPLVPLVREHTRRGADVTVAMNPDDSPAGVYVIRRCALDIVPPAGFMDLKEQWLTRIVNDGRLVLVHRLPLAGTMPLHTLEQLRAAAHAAGTSAPGPLRVAGAEPDAIAPARRAA